MTTSPVVLSDAVAAALADGRPVVALESTIISHGLPRPRNFEAARSFEATLTEAGVTPATIALVDGVPHVGMDDAALHRIAEDETVEKVSSRDLSVAMVKGVTGGTTVAATAVLANLAGIRVFSTGGLGGVHRGAAQSFDESADLTMLSRVPITVVSAGAKSILDIHATLERLDSLGVTLLGYRTTRYPGFYLSDSGFEIDWKVDSADEIAGVMAARDALGQSQAVLVANPIPADQQLDPAVHDSVLEEALALVDSRGITGKAVTPFLLDYFQAHTHGASLEVNLDIVVNNIRLGAQIATAWAARRQG